MAKNKLRRFAEMKEMPNVLEPTLDEIKSGGVDFKGKWNSTVFKNDHPITVELGCGKGEYSVGLAKKYPNRNFIGVDIKGSRMWVGANEALELGLDNVAFLRTKVDFIDSLFAPGEVDEIWLTFSDPQPNKPNKRLSSKYFIDRYRKILKPHGIIHLKTDSDLLFESTEEEIQTHGYTCHYLTWDLYNEIKRLPENIRDILHIKTHYEELFTAKGFTIKYCQFSIDA
ncbi:MAG: tRNA (guanosine(46)-N7)-methyltransferase TrmB [Crocinitomicaceae bacterium]|nr:tRNA (guanosine(46)-N7)-methyltransferase TrmB [Crocinitomicaceae bacterium]